MSRTTRDASAARRRYHAAVPGALVALGWPDSPLLAQAVYKTVDAQGHVVCSDRAPTKNAPKTTVHVDQADPAEAARLAKEQAELKAADLERSVQQAADDKN